MYEFREREEMGKDFTIVGTRKDENRTAYSQPLQISFRGTKRNYLKHILLSARYGTYKELLFSRERSIYNAGSLL